LGLRPSRLSRIRAAARKAASPSLPLPLLKTPCPTSRRFSFQRAAALTPEFISVRVALPAGVIACADEWPARRTALPLAGAGLHQRNFN
jgi:hypothetical protein